MFKIYKILDKGQRYKLIFLIFLMFIASVLEMLGISLIVPTLMSLSNENFFEKYAFLDSVNALLNYPSNKELVLISATLLGSVYLLKNLYMLFFYWIESHFLSSVIEKISQNLLYNYLNKNYSFYTEINTSVLINRFRADLPAVRGSVNGFLTIFTEGLILLSLTIFLALFETNIFLLVFLFVFLISSIFYTFFKSKFNKLGIERQSDETKRSKTLQESFDAIKEIKISRLENIFIHSYELISNKLKNNFAQSSFLQSIPRIFFELVAVSILIGLIFFITFFSSSSTSILPIIGVFGGASLKFLPAANRIVSSLNRIKYNSRSLDLIKEDLKKDHVKIKKIMEIKNFNEIKLNEVDFKYSDKLILKNFNLLIKKKDKIFIYGDTGSGKSTFIDLLLGLRRINKGNLFFDGNDFSRKSFSMSSIVGYVSQSLFLFDDTIKNNIIMFKEKQKNKNLENSLRVAQLDDFVKNLRNNLNTFIGQNGIKISSGQKQRIGIAREIYKNPEIFILDESTNSLDTDTEQKFLKEFMDFAKSKTVIMVSHNQNLKCFFDKVYKIKNGKLNEEKNL